MLIYELVQEYKNRFGIKQKFISNIRINKWFLPYLILCFSFHFLFLYFFKINNNLLMMSCLSLYWIVLTTGARQHKKKMIEMKPINSFGYNIRPFLQMLNEKFSINNNEQLKFLNDVVKQEMDSLERSRKFPFEDIIRQMIVAIPVTGLLSYAVYEIREGNLNSANPLVATYFLCIGSIILAAGVLKQIRDFGVNSYLDEISMMIKLSLLEQSIDNSPIIPSKNKMKSPFYLFKS